ncbi:MAG: hypothetical protein Kow00122_21420 [Thermoleophilia bacterium]
MTVHDRTPAYAGLYRSHDRRLALLSGWLSYHNQQRPHTALRSPPPMAFLVNKVCGHHS